MITTKQQVEGQPWETRMVIMPCKVQGDRQTRRMLGRACMGALSSGEC